MPNTLGLLRLCSVGQIGFNSKSRCCASNEPVEKSEESEERGRKEKAETRREKVDDEVISRRPR
jgi:hypothetical protein